MRGEGKKLKCFEFERDPSTHQSAGGEYYRRRPVSAEETDVGRGGDGVGRKRVEDWMVGGKILVWIPRYLAGSFRVGYPELQHPGFPRVDTGLSKPGYTARSGYTRPGPRKKMRYQEEIQRANLGEGRRRKKEEGLGGGGRGSGGGGRGSAVGGRDLAERE
ncbi:hypothetical protein QYF36_025149 [Acer negundo]|nr:hypothetical protein QYF36_025149 [Acer negundo]